MTLPAIGCFDLLIFLYFFTAHADQLSFTCAGFSLRLNNVLACLLLGLIFLRMPALQSFDKKILLALILVTVSFVFSTILSDDVGRSSVFLCWWGITLLLYLFLPAMLMRWFAPTRILQLYLTSFLCVGLYASLQLFFSFFHLYDPFAGQWIQERWIRPNAWAYEPSYYALYMTPFVIMANAHYLMAKEKSFLLFHKLKLPHLLLINLLYLLSTSTAVIFAYLLFIGVGLLFSQLRKKIIKFGIYLLASLITLTLFFPYLVKNYLLKFAFHGFMEHHSFFERWVGIVNAWKIFVQHPFFGIGLGAVPSYLFEAWSMRDQSFFYLPSAEDLVGASLPLKYFEPSNVLTEALASVGIFGFVALGYLVWLLFAQLKKSHEHWTSLFFISTIVFLIVLQFNQGLFRTYVWIHCALGFTYSGINHEKP